MGLILCGQAVFVGHEVALAPRVAGAISWWPLDTGEQFVLQLGV